MLSKLVKSTILLLSIMIVACSPKQSELIVAEYGNYDITMSEFEKAYTKNVGSFEKASNDSIKHYKKFLDLYVNFKMKLRDAKVRRLNEDQIIING